MSLKPGQKLGLALTNGVNNIGYAYFIVVTITTSLLLSLFIKYLFVYMYTNLLNYSVFILYRIGVVT